MYTGRLIKDLGTLPRIAAETVGECGPNAGYLLRRLGHVYRSNQRWGRLLYRDCQRSPGTLYSFLTHWLYGWMVRQGSLSTADAIKYQREAGCFSGSQIEIGR